jgi:tetratricopeptide (TPR) repeat protein
MYAHYLGAIGKLEESIYEMRLGLEMEPLSINFNSCMGIMLFIGKYYDEAIEQLRKTIEMDTKFNQAYYWLGRAYFGKGDVDLALEMLGKAATFPETKSMSEATRAYILAIQGDTEKARDIIANIESLFEKEFVDFFFLALAYVGLYDFDTAIKYLEKGYQNKSMYIYYLTTDPILEPMHLDERFIKLAKKLELIQ